MTETDGRRTMRPIRVPAADPRANFLAHRGEIEEAVARVLDSGRYILGDEVAAFETEFAHYLETRAVVGVASGTDALVLALRSCGVGPGDSVLTVSHTSVATVAAIELAGAAAVLVDIDPASFTIDCNHLEDTIVALRRTGDAAGRNVKAVVPVHLYGHPADLPGLLDIAKRHNLRIIEDCAQAHGARVDGRPVGTWGDASAFSFYPTKNLGALGDGGAVATGDADLAGRIVRLREYGWERRNFSVETGWNSRLDEMQAAVLRVKLRHLDAENAARRELAAAYIQGLAGTGLVTPVVPEASSHVFHQFVVRSTDRDGLKAFLGERGIGTLVHYPLPVHLQPAYRGRVRLGPGGLPQTERACAEVLSLPIHPQLSLEAVRRVSDAISEWAHRTS